MFFNINLHFDCPRGKKCLFFTSEAKSFNRLDMSSGERDILKCQRSHLPARTAQGIIADSSEAVP